MAHLNYHHLLYFKSIAENGGISKASQKLKIGQSSLSLQLKTLEETLGVELFYRVGRGLELSEMGKIVYRYAKSIEDLGSELLSVVDSKTYPQQATLSVGALDSIPKNLICDIVDYAHKETSCFFSIYEDQLENLLNSLSQHSLDFLITDTEVRHLRGSKVFSKLIFRNNLNAYAAPKFKDLKINFPLSLNGNPCIVPTVHSKIRSNIENYFHLKKIEPKLIAETQDTSLQKILAAKGDGVIFLPEFAARNLVKEKTLLKIGELENVYCDFYIVHNKRVFDNPALSSILNSDKIFKQ